MRSEDVLGNRLVLLQEIIRNGFEDAPAQVQGFVARVLDRQNRNSTRIPLYQDRTVEDYIDAVRFDGYPSLARVGYRLAHESHANVDGDVADRVLQCIDQQRNRPSAKQAEFAGDSLALLGITDGLRMISPNSEKNAEKVKAARAWVRELIEQHGGSDTRLARVRMLAIDLLDEQGRFGLQLAQSDDAGLAALDLCLWQGWIDVLRTVTHPDTEQRRALFKTLLTTPPPREGELLHAATWLCALDVLTDDVVVAAVPDEYQVARILSETQGSFRRWRWEKKATRKETMPARWLIDKEADVQAFLLAVLYPYFTDELEDEQYLRGFGLRQGRFDFAISSLGLIIEVKVVRKTRDINVVEAEIADDLALYFKTGNPFRTMIVYIYDDRDKPEPENYPKIRDTLKQRSDRIVDVVVVQRPSMIPGRDDRSGERND